MPKIRATTKAAVFRRDGAACRYCGIRVFRDVAEQHPRRLTMDHLWPDSGDGSNGMHNLVISCRQCNRRKASAEPTGKWMPLPPPVKPPRLETWTPGSDTSPIVDTDRCRLLVPYVSRTRIREMEGVMSSNRDAMWRLRWHQFEPVGPSVDGVTTP